MNASSENQPATAVPSASLVVVRDGEQGIEVLLLKRNPSLRFAAASLVFPGGSLDEDDQLIAAQWRENGSAETLLEHRVAAIREAFEEANILPAERNGHVLSQSDLRGLKLCRQYLLEGRLSFNDFLKSKQVALNAGSLLHFAHWVTPERAKRRFSTHFFLMEQPSNQCGEPDGGEMVDARWYPVNRVEDELDENNRMMFPTRANCRLIAGFETVAELFRALGQREVVPVMPKIERRGEESWFVIPAEAGYPLNELIATKGNTP